MINELFINIQFINAENNICAQRFGQCYLENIRAMTSFFRQYLKHTINEEGFCETDKFEQETISDFNKPLQANANENVASQTWQEFKGLFTF